MSDFTAVNNYALALPGGWFRIDLTRGEASAHIDTLLAERFAGYPKQPLIIDELRQSLLGQAAAARSAGGLELFLSLMGAYPLTVPAALLITLTPPNPQYTGTAALAQAIQRLGTARHVSTVNLPAGEAVRWSQSRETAASLSPQPSTPRRTQGFRTELMFSGFSLNFQIAVPGESGARLGLSFSSPVNTLEEPLTELFNAIAETLRWTS